MAMTQGAVKAFILANWYRTGQRAKVGGLADVAPCVGLYTWSTMGYICCIYVIRLMDEILHQHLEIELRTD